MDELAPGEGVTASSGESWFTTRQLIGMGLGALGLAVLVLAVRARRRGRMPALPVLVELGMKRIGWRPPDFLRRWAHRARMTSMERAYAEIDRSLERLGAAAGPADTAAERAAALTRLLPDGSSMVSILLDHYQAAIYGRRTVKDEGIEDAAHALRRLAWRRRLIRLLGRA
jgi:hypothetical protein